jgi:hypothetical protein
MSGSSSRAVRLPPSMLKFRFLQQVAVHTACGSVHLATTDTQQMSVHLLQSEHTKGQQQAMKALACTADEYAGFCMSRAACCHLSQECRHWIMPSQAAVSPRCATTLNVVRTAVCQQSVCHSTQPGHSQVPHGSPGCTTERAEVELRGVQGQVAPVTACTVVRRAQQG